MKNKLLIFIKNPELGKAKTRMASSIGKEKALLVYEDLLQKTRSITLPLKADRYLYYSEFIDQADAWDGNRFQKRMQVQGDLGIRLLSACEEVEEEGFEKLILIGSDCYDLSTAHLEEAFQKLEENDMVIGPANDGGYYLLGIKQLEKSLFEGIDWSTDRVLKQTTDVAHAKKWKVHLLEELIDLDTFEDLKESGFPIQKLKDYAKND